MRGEGAAGDCRIGGTELDVAGSASGRGEKYLEFADTVPVGEKAGLGESRMGEEGGQGGGLRCKRVDCRGGKMGTRRGERRRRRSMVQSTACTMCTMSVFFPSLNTCH